MCFQTFRDTCTEACKGVRTHAPDQSINHLMRTLAYVAAGTMHAAGALLPIQFSMCAKACVHVRQRSNCAVHHLSMAPHRGNVVPAGGESKARVPTLQSKVEVPGRPVVELLIVCADMQNRVSVEISALMRPQTLVHQWWSGQE